MRQEGFHPHGVKVLLPLWREKPARSGNSLVIDMVDACAKCPHLISGPFCGLDEKHLETLRGLLQPYSVEGKGKTIFNQGQPLAGVYFLCAGIVKLTQLRESGDEIILHVLSPCAVIGEVPRLDPVRNQRHEYSAISLTNTVEVRFLKTPDYRFLPKLLPDIQGRFTEYCCERLSQVYTILEMMKLPVEERLVSMLRHFMAQATSATFVPLSFAEMAQFVQTTPETISRTVRRLISKGQVEIVKGKLFLRNPAEPPRRKH